jgi:hypothetical protein
MEGREGSLVEAGADCPRHDHEIVEAVSARTPLRATSSGVPAAVIRRGRMFVRANWSSRSSIR